MSCLASADMAVTGGILGAASLRVGLRRYLPTLPFRRRKAVPAEACTPAPALADH